LIDILASYPGHLDRIMMNTDYGSMFLEHLIDFITDEKISAEATGADCRSQRRRFSTPE
jgi:hypothetical protein